MSKLNESAKSIAEKYVATNLDVQINPKNIQTRSAQSEINRIEAVITSLSNGNISQGEVLRLETACLKLLGRIRALAINSL